MMRRKLVLLLNAALLLAVTAGALAQSGGDYDLEWQVIGSTGDELVAGGDYQIGFTLGQAQDTPLSAGGSYQIAQGYWAGGGAPPTAVGLVGFWIEARSNTLAACWETASEIDTLGFHLYRSDTGESGSFVLLNDGLIPAQAPGSPMGARYEWADAGAAPGRSYFYLLEAVDVYGQAMQYGPAPGSLPIIVGIYHRAYLPLVSKGH
ncbi:MAG: hypothetical protein JXM73_14910 [Anaerolineae bacterium]|nr:hypothetical protein [Anaerolineae bacterium]